jgi:hypothetical protein
MKALVNVYAFVVGCVIVYGKLVLDGLDWFGRKLVDLIDNSDFFAGCVTTAAVISVWELLTK